MRIKLGLLGLMSLGLLTAAHAADDKATSKTIATGKGKVSKTGGSFAPEKPIMNMTRKASGKKKPVIGGKGGVRRPVVVKQTNTLTDNNKN